MPNRLIRAFDVVDGGKKLANNRVFIDAETGTPDGFRVDIAGNLWCGWGMGDAELDGVRIFNAAGTPIGHIALPERAANLCFGGRFRNRLFMAASHGLYALYVNTQGAPGRLTRRTVTELLRVARPLGAVSRRAAQPASSTAPHSAPDCQSPSLRRSKRQASQLGGINVRRCPHEGGGDIGEDKTALPHARHASDQRNS